eukprot:jgi/Orpsp1_1/1179915/evm.model.c7180000071330.1
MRMIKLLVENKIDIKRYYGVYGNALFKAVRVNRIEIVKYIIENGANLHGSLNRNNALNISINIGNIEMTKTLIDYGFNVNKKYIFTVENSLFYSIVLVKIEYVKFLVENGIDINVRQKGNTALTLASKIGNIEIVKCLIEKGIYMYAKDKKGNDAIMNALIFNHPDIVKYLLFNEENNFLKNNNQCIEYFKLACKVGLFDIAKYLIYNGIAITEEDINNFEDDIIMKPKIEYISSWIFYLKERNCLKFYTNSNSNEDITKLDQKIENGNKIKLVEDGMRNKIENGKIKLVEDGVKNKYENGKIKLVEDGMRNKIENGKIKLVEDGMRNKIENGKIKLVEDGVKNKFENINERKIKTIGLKSEENILTSLIMTRFNGNFEIGNILIKQGININKKDENGYDALMVASQKGYINIVQALVKS